MLRNQNGDGDKDYQHEEQDRASDAAAPWRKVLRIVGARHLQSKQIERGFVRALPPIGERGRYGFANYPVRALRSEPRMKKTAKSSTTIRANKRKAKRRRNTSSAGEGGWRPQGLSRPFR
jgi:hypothetical protein